MDRIQIHANWTNTVQHIYKIALDELTDAAKRDLLKSAFINPERHAPHQDPSQPERGSRRQLFAALAMNLRRRGHEAHEVAHFENRDSVLTLDGSRADWPTVDMVIGNAGTC